MKTDEAQLEIYPLEWSCPSNYATLYVKEYPQWVTRMSDRPTQIDVLRLYFQVFSGKKKKKKDEEEEEEEGEEEFLESTLKGDQTWVDPRIKQI